jgi:hypothetical protein
VRALRADERSATVDDVVEDAVRATDGQGGGVNEPIGENPINGASTGVTAVTSGASYSTSSS